MKKCWLFAAAVLMAAAAATAILLSSQKFGHLDIRVMDAYTLLPQEAVVVLPETGTSVQASGESTVLSGIPVKTERPFPDMQERPWGEVTLLVYASGYIPEAVYHVHVYSDRVRQVNIYLFPVGSESEDCISVIESPDAEWTKALLERYSP